MIPLENNTIRTPLSRNLDSLLQKTLSNALAPVLQPHSPRAHNGFSALPASLLLLGGFAVSPAQHKSPNDFLAPFDYHHAVIAQPVPVDLLRVREITPSHPPHGNKTRHDDASEGGAQHVQVVVGLPEALQEDSDEQHEAGEVQRVEDEHLACDLALLGDRVGNQAEAVHAVVLGGGRVGAQLGQAIGGCRGGDGDRLSRHDGGVWRERGLQWLRDGGEGQR
jgi:hypothetical protein